MSVIPPSKIFAAHFLCWPHILDEINHVLFEMCVEREMDPVETLQELLLKQTTTKTERRKLKAFLEKVVTHKYTKVSAIQPGQGDTIRL